MSTTNPIKLQIPDTNEYLIPGCRVKLGRFSHRTWIVGYGWYSYGGNRPIYGWYLTSEVSREVKSIQLPDLADIYLIDWVPDEGNENPFLSSKYLNAFRIHKNKLKMRIFTRFDVVDNRLKMYTYPEFNDVTFAKSGSRLVYRIH